MDSSALGVVQKRLSIRETIWNQGWVRKGLILFLLASIWQVYADHLNNPLMLPTFGQMAAAFWESLRDGELARRVWVTLAVLVKGYAAGLTLAAVLAGVAVMSRLGSDFLLTMTSMMMPLPAIALLPLALIWFGLTELSLIFVMIQSVMWTLALNTYSGFMAVPTTLRMVGRNCGLWGIRYVTKLLIPAAFPFILAGAKIGWAFCWRTLIAAELVFGVTSGSGGLGWFIYSKKNELEIPAVFAGLFTIIIIGLIVENVFFRTIEKRTIRRWGMHG